MSLTSLRKQNCTYNFVQGTLMCGNLLTFWTQRTAVPIDNLCIYFLGRPRQIFHCMIYH